MASESERAQTELSNQGGVIGRNKLNGSEQNCLGRQTEGGESPVSEAEVRRANPE